MHEKELFCQDYPCALPGENKFRGKKSLCFLFQTGDVKEIPTSKQIEKQKVVLEQLTNTLDLPIDKLDSLRYVAIFQKFFECSTLILSVIDKQGPVAKN